MEKDQGQTISHRKTIKGIQSLGEIFGDVCMHCSSKNLRKFHFYIVLGVWWLIVLLLTGPNQIDSL